MLAMDPGVDGTVLRVVETEDVDEGVSGMEEKVFVNVEVPVVGREETGEVGERGVTGESESRSFRPTGRGGGISFPRCRFV